MKLKDDASIRVDNLSSAIVLAIQAADTVWKLMGVPHGVTVTSGCEGKPGDGIHHEWSKHYPHNNESGQGEAVDLRTWNVDAERAGEKLQRFLGPAFDVVVEDTHIHVEHDIG